MDKVHSVVLSNNTILHNQKPSTTNGNGLIIVDNRLWVPDEAEEF